MQRRPGSEHRDDGDKKARIESADEPTDGVCVARQLGDELAVGERKKLGRGEAHDSVEHSILKLQFDVPRPGKDEPLEAWRQHGPDEQKRGEHDKRADW